MVEMLVAGELGNEAQGMRCRSGEASVVIPQIVVWAGVSHLRMCCRVGCGDLEGPCQNARRL